MPAKIRKYSFAGIGLDIRGYDGANGGKPPISCLTVADTPMSAMADVRPKSVPEGPLFKFTGRLRDLVTAVENDSKCTDPVIRSEAARRVAYRQRAPSSPVTPAYWRYASA